MNLRDFNKEGEREREREQQTSYNLVLLLVVGAEEPIKRAN